LRRAGCWPEGIICPNTDAVSTVAHAILRAASAIEPTLVFAATPPSVAMSRDAARTSACATTYLKIKPESRIYCFPAFAGGGASLPPYGPFAATISIAFSIGIWATPAFGPASRSCSRPALHARAGSATLIRLHLQPWLRRSAPGVASGDNCSSCLVSQL